MAALAAAPDAEGTLVTALDVLYNPDVILNLDEDLVCGICRNVINVACQPSEDDSHIFCLACLSQSLTSKPSCPVCCCPASPESVTKVAFIDRRINNLRAKCYAHGAGCAWQGSFLTLREQHWPSECTLHGEPCALCEEIVPASHRVSHLAEVCPKKRLMCVLCNAYVLREGVADHIDRVCPLSSVACPNACGEKYLRRDEDRHLRQECPEAVIPCLTEGCGATLKRKDMDAHLAADPTRHLTLAIRELRALKDLEELRELRAVTAQLADLKGNLRKLESSVYGAKPLVMFDVSQEEFEELQETYHTGMSLDKEFSAFGIEWKAHVYPSGHDDYEDFVSAFVGPVAASLPVGWVELRYKCLFELFADGVSVSHRVDDRVTVPPRPGRYGWFKFVEQSAIKEAQRLQFMVSLLHANVLLPLPEDEEPPAEDRRPESAAGWSLYVVAHVLLALGVLAIFRHRSTR